MDLEKVFNTEQEKKNSARNKYVQERETLWNQCLVGAREVYAKLSFLKEKGYSVEIQYDHAFNYDLDSNGRHPNVRVNKIITIHKHILDDDCIMVSSLGKFALMGEKHTYESFIKKLIN